MVLKQRKKYIVAFLLIYLIGLIIYGEVVSKPKYSRLKENYLLSTCYTFDFTLGTSYKNNPPSIIFRYQ